MNDGKSFFVFSPIFDGDAKSGYLGAGPTIYGSSGNYYCNTARLAATKTTRNPYCIKVFRKNLREPRRFSGLVVYRDRSCSLCFCSFSPTMRLPHMKQPTDTREKAQGLRADLLFSYGWCQGICLPCFKKVCGICAGRYPQGECQDHPGDLEA